MAYRLDFSVRAVSQIDAFFEYLRRLSFQTAEKYEYALQEAIDTYLVNSPTTFDFYRETGAPYRAFLFTVSRRSRRQNCPHRAQTLQRASPIALIEPSISATRSQ